MDGSRSHSRDSGAGGAGYSAIPDRGSDDQGTDFQKQAPADDTSRSASPLASNEAAGPLDESDTPPEKQDLDTQYVQKAKTSWECIIADVAAIAIPAALLGFAAASVAKDGQEGSKKYIDDWVNVASVLSTLFPLFFAAVFGRLVMQTARYKLEQGSTLLSLEQLLGSRTVGGALLSPFYLRCFNYLTAGLILFWAFSPLGAQGMLRIVEPRASERVDSSIADGRSFDLRGPAWDEDTSNPGTGPVPYSEITVLSRSLNSLLLAGESSKNDTVDLWGNPKIPLFATLQGDADENGWKEVAQEKDTIYASLVGVPLYSDRRMDHDEVSMMVESTYLETACDGNPDFYYFDQFIGDEVHTALGQLRNLTSKALYSDYLEDPPSSADNGTFQGYGYNDDMWNSSGANLMPLWTIGVDRFMDSRWANGTWVTPNDGEHDILYSQVYRQSLNLFENKTDVEVGPMRLIIQSMLLQHPLKDADVFAEIYCNVTQRYVESELRCEKTERSTRRACRAVAQRPSRRASPHESITYLSFPHIFDYVSATLPNTTGASITRGHNRYMESTLHHLFPDDMIPSYDHDKEVDHIDKSDFNEKLFGQRLSQVLNTYIQLRQLGNVVNGRAEPEIWYHTTNAPMKAIHSVTKFHSPKEWAALCIISCLLLLAGGAASVAVAHISAGPEVLGLASTAVRDNKYMSLDRKVSLMEGHDVSAKLKDMRVRLGVMKDDAFGEKLGVGYQNRVIGIKETLKARGD